MVDIASVQTEIDFTTVEPGKLRIITSDIEARPMSFVDSGQRLGFEPTLARVVCDRLQIEPVWFNTPLKDFYTELSTGNYDLVWFNQAITQERRAWADFTRSYGRFDTAVLVREDSEVEHKANLAGKRIGVIAESVSQQLLEFLPPDIEVIYFKSSHQVVTEMMEALQRQQIDAIVEDSLLLMAIEAQDFRVRVAFEIATQRPFGIGILPGNRELLDALNTVLNTLITDGTLNKLWDQWIPYKSCPF
ncbi:MAG: amino acid ABC transporter substrate-binding protein [Leptolyngbya sp. SIO1E4]|nr:amino acid ABC transporter substrate-binding protein [Leptolyngbya sp. SIO1E4]